METAITCLFEQKSLDANNCKNGNSGEKNYNPLLKNIPIQLLRNLLINKTIRKNIIELKKREAYFKTS